MELLDSLYEEYSKVSDRSAQSKLELENLSLFLKDIYIQCSTFYNEINKDIKSFFTRKLLNEVYTKMGQNLNFFYQNILIYLDRFKNALESLYNNTIEPLEKLKFTLYNQSIAELKKFEILITKYKKNNSDLNKSKNNYYISYKELLKNTNNIQNDLNKYKELKAKNNNLRQIYKYEITYSNSLYTNYEKEYISIYKNIQEMEEKRLNSLNLCINNFISFIDSTTTLNKETNNQIKSKMSSWNIEDERKLFNDEFNYRDNNSQRFDMEKFIDYSCDYKINSDNNRTSNEGIFSMGKKYMQFLNNSSSQNNSSKLNEDYYNQLVDNIIKHLNSDDELSIQSIILANRYINDNDKFSMVLIKKLFNIYNDYHLIKNNNNLIHLSNIFNNIILNNHNKSISYLIVNLSTRLFSYSKNDDNKNNNKIYLCSLTGKNLLYKTDIFWTDLIEHTFKQKMEKEKEIFKLKENNYNNSNEDGQLTFNLNKNLDSLSKYSNKLKSFFIKEQNIPNTQTDIKNNNINNIENDKKKTLIYILNFGAYYDNFPQELQNEFDEKCISTFNKIICEFIQYFINLRWGFANSIEYIVSLCNNYNIPNNYVNYYVTYLNFYTYSIKQFPNSYITDFNILINLDKNTIKSLQPNTKNTKITKNVPQYIKIKDLSDDKKSYFLKQIIPYITSKESINFFLLNKKYTSILSRKIYKHFLDIPTISKSTRIKIWESILLINEIKFEYDYQETSKQIISSSQGNKSLKSPFNIIDLDVSRTLFDKKTEASSRKALCKILKTLSTLMPDPNYCQGMNFLASFLYKYTNSEEETFYLMMGLFNNTKFLKIFFNDLNKLKFYFKIYEKLIFLYLPNVYHFLNENNAQTNFFCSAWFIALFTSTIGNNNNMDCVIKIFDYFLIYGWKCIFNSCLLLLEMKEGELVGLKNEYVLHYLSSEITEKVFSGGDEGSEFIRKLKEMKVKNKVIKSIKNAIKNEKGVNGNKNNDE